MINKNALITVYITCNNYAKYLEEAINSVINQTYSRWELYLINDGSTDDSLDIMKKFKNQYKTKNIFIIDNVKPKGLRVCANDVINKANGEFIIRLDADDYFDENALLLMSNYLMNYEDVSMVFSDWVYISEVGEVLGVERRKKLTKETLVYDLPAHGACSMIRRSVIRLIGGYSPEFDKQDGYELWLKIIQTHKVANINTPLFYYRKHGDSMSHDDDKLIHSRRVIKSKLSQKLFGNNLLKKMAIIPVRNQSTNFPNLAFAKFCNYTFLDKAINDVIETNEFTYIVVDTDDKNVYEYLNGNKNVFVNLRDKSLIGDNVPLSNVIYELINKLEFQHNIFCDLFALIQINCPLREKEHIVEGLNTILLFDVDHVISTYEDLDAHFQHSYYGMKPINPKTIDKLRFEREALYVNNGAIHVFWRNSISRHTMFKGKIGHFLMERSKSIQIKSENDLLLLKSNLI